MTIVEFIERYNDIRLCVISTPFAPIDNLINHFTEAMTIQEIKPIIADMTNKIVETGLADKLTREYKAMREIANMDICIAPGKPIFSHVFINCDLVIFADINESLLMKTCYDSNLPYNVLNTYQHTIRAELEKCPVPVVRWSIGPNTILTGLKAPYIDTDK